MVPVKYETLMIWLLLNMLKARPCLAHVNALNAVVRGTLPRGSREHMLSWVRYQPHSCSPPQPEAEQCGTHGLADLTLNGWK